MLQMVFQGTLSARFSCAAAEELYTIFKGTGATMIGHWPTDGYQHEDSKVTAYLLC